MRALQEAPYVNVFDDEFRADPAAVIDPLRDQTWVVQTPIGCLVIDREHVHRLLSDPRLNSSLLHIVQLQGVTQGPLFEMVSSAILAMDGPDHARVRRLVSRAFTPRATDPHRELMRELVNELVDGFAGSGRCEFMADFGDHYPVQVICHLMGVPRQDHERFARWGDVLTYVLSFDLFNHIEEVSAVQEEMNAYFDALIANRQREPRDDLVSDLIAASEEGDRLTPVELRSLLGGLLFAGYDTTRNQLGLGLSVFCEHPDQWKLLADEPERTAAAVEEVMRYAGVVSITPRVTVEPIEMDGWSIPAGTMMALGLAAANHDRRAYDDPYTFDITVPREPHVTFGGGPHYCLGANLARAEMQEALPILARRMPDLALDGEPQWRSAVGIYGPLSLPLRFTPAT
jgi:cytochrome P450